MAIRGHLEQKRGARESVTEVRERRRENIYDLASTPVASRL